MPPKHKTVDLITCEICRYSFLNKEGVQHESVCSPTAPFTLTLQHGDIAQYDPAFEIFGHVDCHNVSVNHGILGDKTMLGTRHTVKSKDVPVLANIQNKTDVIVLNPTTMQYCHFCYGKPVIVNRRYVLTTWPCTSIPVTAVGVTMECWEKIHLGVPKCSDFVLVEDIDGPCIEVATLQCKLMTPSNLSTNDHLNSYIVKVLVGTYITHSSILNIDYYGQECSICVMNITGVDGTCTPDSSCDETRFSDIDTSIAEEFDELHLKSEGSKVNMSTPNKKSTIAGDIEEHTNNLFIGKKKSTFYKIVNSTKLRITTNDEKLGESLNGNTRTLDDVGGYCQQIETLKDMIKNHLLGSFRQQGFSTPQGALLYGPSGSGKTLLAEALGKYFTTVEFITINGAEVWSKFFGETESKLSSLFQRAKDRAPSLIFFDEIDALCPKRDSTKSEVGKRVVATLLNLLDGLNSSTKKVFVLATTNKRNNIDAALRRPGRLDKEVEIGVPSGGERQQILKVLLRKCQHSCSIQEICDIADKAHGFLGSDLAAVCKEASLHALKRAAFSDVEEVQVTFDDLLNGLQKVKPSAMKEVTLEISKVSWFDIGGQEDLKHKLRQAVEWPLKHPEAFTRLGIRPPRGLLMYGPPGCGKTMIAKALAKESGLNFIAIKGPELFSKWVGESERAVREVFSRARAAAPAVVFFDEIDALASERGSHSGGGGDVSDRVLAQLLTEMDGVEALEDILVVAATNRPDRIDKALMRPGRLDRIVYVPLPDTATRQAIFTIHCKKMPVADDVNVDELVSRTDGYSGAEVSAVCHEAALSAMQENIEAQHVYMRHFNIALCAVTPRITTELMSLYEKYQSQASYMS